MNNLLDRLVRWNSAHLSLIVWILRVSVGATFILSGLAKVIDEWGFVYKIEQYLSVWDITVPRTLVLSGAILLSGAEFTFGVLLLSGCYRRVVTWLLAATMAFMLPLTFYIMAYNPVSDCGCFGDMITLSNQATFYKNVALTLAIIYLVKYNRRVLGLYRPYYQWIVAFLAGLYALIVALIGYNVQPMVDFRQFPIGSRLVADSGDEDEDVRFIYEKGGERRMFGSEELPDSTWTYVDREDSSAMNRDGAGLSIFDGDDDVTASVLHGEGDQLFLLIPDMRRADISYTYLINELNRYINRNGGEMAGILSTDRTGIEAWIDYSMARYPCYSADDTAIKELVRGNVGLVYVKDGVIQWKRNLWSVPSDILDVTDNPLRYLSFNGGKRLAGLSVVLLILLMMVGVLQSMGLVIRNKFLVKHKNKPAEE